MSPPAPPTAAPAPDGAAVACQLALARYAPLVAAVQGPLAPEAGVDPRDVARRVKASLWREVYRGYPGMPRDWPGWSELELLAEDMLLEAAVIIGSAWRRGAARE